MTYKKIIVLVLITGILLACGLTDPSESDVQTAIAMTAAAEPTDVPVMASNTPTPTETPSPTDTPEPTETPLPTETPMPTETVTPRPTNAPRATATPDEAASVVAYTQALQEQFLDLLVPALDTIAVSMGASSENPAIALEDDYQADLTEAVLTIYGGCFSVEAMEGVPDVLRASHEEILNACEDYKMSGASLLLFLEDPLESIEQLTLSTTYMNSGTDHLTVAIALLPD